MKSTVKNTMKSTMKNTMKNLFAKLFISCVLVLSAVSLSFAAGSITFTKYEASKTNQATWVQLVAVFTADASDASIPTTMIPYDLRGTYLYSVEYYYGSTGPTDNSDLEILEHSITGKDILYGAGANIIDNATNAKPTMPSLYDGPGVIPIYGNQYIKISNNAVNSATGTLILRYIR